MIGARDRPPAGGGFTIVEVLLVLAVIALLAALLLPGVNSVLRSINDERPEQVVWDAITAARERALVTNRTVWLRSEPRERRLVWGDEADRQQRDLPDGTNLQFLQPSEGNVILVGGVLIDTQEVPAVRFYPDGTCDRFRVQLQQGTGAARVIRVDPWTCAPLLASTGP